MGEVQDQRGAGRDADRAAQVPCGASCRSLADAGTAAEASLVSVSIGLWSAPLLGVWPGIEQMHDTYGCGT
jgi:hypothetical protein